MTDQWPTWLKVMENGSAGEARTKAFLLDRFWVLERSVDIDGADFLYQRRTTTQRFTDKSPPRIGVVQAKYFQDSKTTHYIPKTYILDDNGAPLEGFFALLHVGIENDSEMFLLSARQIHEHLATSEKDAAVRYVVGRKALVPEFRVTNRALALDRLEHSLKQQDYRQASAIYDHLYIPFRKIDEDAIDFDWKLPLPNPVGSIPRMFRDYKDELRSITFEMEEVLDHIDKILVTTDPKAGLALVKALKREHVDGSGRLTFGWKADFFWGDFEPALERHQAALSKLKGDGSLDGFVDITDRLDKALKAAAVADPAETEDEGYQLDLTYDPQSLASSSTISDSAASSIDSAFASRASQPTPGAAFIASPNCSRAVCWCASFAAFDMDQATAPAR